ncbi:MAG: undecaprenyl-diphosphate phosphatase [Candidatus Binatia bacterium]
MSVLVGLKAIVLGLVEGATEFLPVSSTGHLIIAAAWLDYPAAQRATFEIFIQLGAIGAVYWHYRRDLFELVRRAPADAHARALLGKILLAFVPAAAVGFLFHEWIEAHLFSVRSVAWGLIAGGALIWIVERRSRPIRASRMEDISWRDALSVGCAQVAALYPGISRAGATIIGGLIVGLSRPAATQFSFYLALPTLTAASLFSLIKGLPRLDAAEAFHLGLGFIAAFASALAVIRVFIAYVQTHDFRAFAYYRIAFGLLLLAVT